jgi:nicotinamide mononucleotide transporter
VLRDRRCGGAGLSTLDVLEVVAVVFGLVSVWLSVREHIASWPTAIVTVSLYFVIFYDARLYADMGLQVFFASISVYGWYHWLYGGEHRTVLLVSRTPAWLWWVLPVLWVAGFGGLGFLLARTTDAALPFVDSALTVGSLIAQWMMTRKYLENWIVWVLLDVAYIALFISRGLELTAVLYAGYLVLASNGYLEWRRSLLRHAA